MKVASILLVAVSVLAQRISAGAIEKKDISPEELTPIPINDSNEGSVICNECTKDPGICCPVECQSDSRCPSAAIANAGWLIDGTKITSNSKKH